MPLLLYQTAGSKFPLRWFVIVTEQEIFLARVKGQIIKQERQRVDNKGVREGESERARKERVGKWERESNGGVKSEGKPKPPGCCWLAALVFRAVYLHCMTHAHSHNHTYLMVICTHTCGSKYVQLLLKKLKILLTYENSSHVCCNKRTAKWTTS